MSVLPHDERNRQVALDAFDLDDFSETAFDDLVQLAVTTLQAPIATISIINLDRQWFSSPVGLDMTETPRELASFDRMIRPPDELLVVEDALRDGRFANNPMVIGEPLIRFYAAAPLKISSRKVVGTLCAVDTRPRKIDLEKLEHMRFLEDQVIATLETRKATLGMRPMPPSGGDTSSGPS